MMLLNITYDSKREDRVNLCSCGRTFTDAEAAVKITPHLSDPTRQHRHLLCPACGLLHKTREEARP